MTNKPERVGSVCSQNKQLNSLLQRAQQLNQLNIILQQTLPMQFTNHCYLANISSQSIIVHTDNANFASLIRFQATSLCEVLSKHLPQPVSKLEVKVKPAKIMPVKSIIPHNIALSSQAASTISQAAKSMANGKLKIALENLAQRYNNHLS